MLIQAARRLSESLTVEKITHYQKMLSRIKHRLLQLDHDTAPMTTRRYIDRAIRIEKRIHKLQTKHRH